MKNNESENMLDYAGIRVCENYPLIKRFLTGLEKGLQSGDRKAIAKYRRKLRGVQVDLARFYYALFGGDPWDVSEYVGASCYGDPSDKEIEAIHGAIFQPLQDLVRSFFEENDLDITPFIINNENN